MHDFDRRVAQLASSWVRSTRNFKPSVLVRIALKQAQRRPEVSWTFGPRLEASRATPRSTGVFHSFRIQAYAALRHLVVSRLLD